MKTVMIIIAIFICNYLYSTDYYVDTSGDDISNFGTSSSSPWKTLYKISQQDLEPGDTINLKRGCRWDCDDNERLYFSSCDTGSSGNPIIVRPYGDGTQRPVLDAIQVFRNSDDSTKWYTYNTDIWYLVDYTGTSRLWFDGVEKREAENINGISSETPWLYDPAGKLYVYCQNQNPADAGIELLGTRSPSPIEISQASGYLEIRGMEIHGGREWNGQIYILGGHDIIIEDNVFLKTGGNGIRITGNKNGYGNSSNIIIRNNIIDGLVDVGEYDYELFSSHDGIALSSGAYCLIYNNTLRDFTHTAIDFATDSDENAVIEYSEAYDNIVINTNVSYGRGMAISGTNARYNKIYRNIFTDCDTRSQFGGGHHNEIYENIFDTATENETKTYQTAQGLAIASYKGPIYSNKIYNNIFYNLESYGIDVKSYGEDVYNNEIANNIIVDCGGEVSNIGINIEHKNSEVYENIYKNNVIYNNASNNVISYNNTTMTVSQWNNITPLEDDVISDNYSFDPELIDPVNKIFGLRASSFCIDSGAAGCSFGDIGALPNENFNGLVAFYSLNEGSGSNIYDRSINEIDAIFTGYSWLQEGYSEKISAELTGSNSISTSSISSGDYFTDKLTLMAVVDLDATTVDQGIIEMNQVFCLKTTSDNKLSFCAYNSSQTASSVTSQGLLSTGEQYIAVTVNGIDVTFYRNGTACGTGQLASSFDAFYSTIQSIKFGTDTINCDGLEGAIDEIRILNTTLNATEVSRAYKSSTDDGLVLHYKCDGNTNDSSGNVLNGVLASGTGYASSTGYIKQALSMANPNPNEYIETQSNVQTSDYFTRDLSYCGWVYFTGSSLSESPCLVDKSGTFKILIGSSTGKMYLYSYDSQGRLNDTNVSTNSSVVSYNEWMHLGVVQHGTSVTFYKNGEVIKVDEISCFDRFYDSNNKIRFGCSSSGTCQMLGKIDEVKLFNKALTQQEVINNM